MSKDTDKSIQNLLSKDLKIAIIHDFLIEYGGAEKVLEAMLEVFPRAHVFTTAYWPEKFPEKYRDYIINTGFIQKLPFHKSLFNQYKIFHPTFFEGLDLSGYNLVISTSAGFAKGVLTHPSIPHIAYIHTPPRFLWGMETTRHDNLSLLTRFSLTPLEHYWRIWDFNAAQRPTTLIANSEAVKKRIKKIYNRNAEVIHPPVEVSAIRNNIKSWRIAPELETKVNSLMPFFFVHGRLTKYKKIDLVIEAFKKLKYNLVISGDGEELKYLKVISKNNPNIHLLGRTSDQERNTYLDKSEAMIFAGAEDFGIVLVEALAAGKPVIAYNKDGASEILHNGKHGVLFESQTPSDIIRAVQQVRKTRFDREELTNRALEYSKEKFKSRFKKLAIETVEQTNKRYSKSILES